MRKQRTIGFVVNILCIILTTAFVFVRYDNETEQNTETTQASIKDVQCVYKYGKNSRRSAFITFSADDRKYVCRVETEFFLSQNDAIRATLSVLEAAEESERLVTIISSDERIVPFDSALSEKSWAVGVFTDENVICSLDKHNSEQRGDKITDLIIIAVWLLLSCSYFFIMGFLRNPQRKWKKGN